MNGPTTHTHTDGERVLGVKLGGFGWVGEWLGERWNGVISG
jgi:hypothetical protein